jgi:thiol-disulfide isomerase/thioredoxin
MTRRLLPTALLLSLLALPAIADAPKDAPDITLATINGKPMRVADLKGNVVLLDFWASWCIPCRKSFPAVDALYAELKDKGLVVVAVNVDEQQKNAYTFLEKFPHTMTVAFDPKGAVAQAFKLEAMPSSLIVDRSGHIRYRHMGYTEKTIAQFRAEVLQLLGESE